MWNEWEREYKWNESAGKRKEEEDVWKVKKRKRRKVERICR